MLQLAIRRKKALEKVVIVHRLVTPEGAEFIKKEVKKVKDD